MINSIYDVTSYATGYAYLRDDPFIISGQHRYATQDFTSSTVVLFESDKAKGIASYGDGNTYQHFTWTPSYGLDSQNEPVVNEIKFGMGFSQRLTDGVNNNLLKLNLGFENRKYQETLAISYFLHAQAGAKSFIFQPAKPFSTQKLFICPTWNVKMNFFDSYTITAQFNEVVF